MFSLSAQGRKLADANVYDLGESPPIYTEPETGAKIYAHLDKFIIADDVTLATIRRVGESLYRRTFVRRDIAQFGRAHARERLR